MFEDKVKRCKAHIISSVVMDDAAFKVSHSAFKVSDIDATTL